MTKTILLGMKQGKLCVYVDRIPGFFSSTTFVNAVHFPRLIRIEPKSLHVFMRETRDIFGHDGFELLDTKTLQTFFCQRCIDFEWI